MVEPPIETKRLEIKKYPNRRYYDATHSRHLTLDEIRNLVHQGYDLRAIDAKTGTDITAQVLTQIILELETAKLDSLPVPLLLRMIRRNDELLRAFVDKYFNQALQSFLAYQHQWDEQFRRTHELAANPFPAVTDWMKAVWSPFAGGMTPANPAWPVATPPEQGEDIVLRKLEALEQEVEHLRGQKPRKRARKRAASK